MVKFISKHRSELIFVLLFFIYFTIQAICLVYTSDDIRWIAVPDISGLFGEFRENGRYFTNILTWVCAHSIILRDVIYVASMMCFTVTFAKLTKQDHSFTWIAFLLTVLIFFFSPRPFFAHVFNWVSGFTNYIISLALLFSYFIYCSPIFAKKESRGGVLWGIVFLIVGFLGALCVENITIYNAVFGVFIILFSLITRKKITTANAAFLLGTVIGAAVMFSAGNYAEIAGEGDSLGFRSFEFAVDDIMAKIYLEIIPFYSRPFYYLHLLISLSVSALYIRKFRNSDKKPKYGALCTGIIIFYFIFTFFCNNANEVQIMSNAYKSRALEVAFTFIYILALIYMCYVLMEGERRAKAIVYIISTLIVTGPFIVINPITRRCFFADYIFWCLFTFRLVAEVITIFGITEPKNLRRAAALFSCGVFCWLSYYHIANKYVDVLRVKYIKEQLDTNQRHIDFIKLPYPNTTFDVLGDIDTELDLIEIDGVRHRFDELYYEQNGIDQSVRDRVRVEINMIDYNTSHDE